MTSMPGVRGQKGPRGHGAELAAARLSVITDTNSEDRLVQQTFAQHLRDKLGWESVYAWKEENFGPSGTLGRAGLACCSGAANCLGRGRWNAASEAEQEDRGVTDSVNGRSWLG